MSDQIPVIEVDNHPDFRARAIAIVLADPTNQRLLESIAPQLELTPILLSEQEASDQAKMVDVDLVIADEAIAYRLRSALQKREENLEHVIPSLIAAIPPTVASVVRARDEIFEGIVTLPQLPAALVAQLSIMLYAHRAYARRFQSTLDELTLNRSIFRSVTSGISIALANHPDMPLTYVNPAFEVMTGYSLEEVVGKNCRFLQGEDRNQPGLTLVREALAVRRETVAILRNYRRNGEPFWNELALSPIRDRDGEITHFVGIQSDITARVAFEEALRESEKLAAVGRLSASIAHEINNPLESMMNLIYLARQEQSGADRDQYLLQAEKELQRVSLITHQSLRFYKQSTKPQAVRPVELIATVLDVYSTQLTMNSIIVERRDRMCESIVCLESEIRQVLNNLVSNARDAMRGRGGRLLLRTREAIEWHTGARGIVITVADTGCGMDAHTLSRLYDAFYTTKGNQGTGLGMWVSAGIIKRHHGRLLVRSRQSTPSGTVFQLFLPYQGSAPPQE